MKKIIFIITVLAGSGALALLSFSREVPQEKEARIAIDFSEGERLYSWNADKKAFEGTSLTGSKRSPDGFFLHQFSPIDGIYYRSEDEHPFTLSKKWDRESIAFGSGLFICDMQTTLLKYEFHLDDMTITPKGRGVFLVDTTHQKTRIFSFDSFLDIDLVQGAERSRITGFTLFPSLLFTHNPTNTSELKGADILRISIVDSIRYIDAKTPEDSRKLFSWNTIEKDGAFLSEVQKNITLRLIAFADIYATLRDQDSTKWKSGSFFDTSSAFLINGSKKEVLLKNALVENIRWFLAHPKKTEYSTTISSIMSDMRALNPRVYAEGVSILRQYYSVAVFSRFASQEHLFDFSWQEPPFLSLAEKIITGTPPPKKREDYIHLGNLFGVYYFLSLESKEFNSAFEKILQKILDNKVLSKDEFLPFVFFVTQYLSTGPVTPDEDTMLIISHLFRITNDYYGNNAGDETKLATITSTIFYNYTRIFAKMYRVFSDVYVDVTPDGLLLKKDYLDGENANFGQSFIDVFTKVIYEAKKGMENRKSVLYSKNSIPSDSPIIDSYTLLKTTLNSFDTIISMFSNYPKYLNDFHLNDTSKIAKGILIEKENEMSREILETYLKGFNSLDISSLQLMNNFQKDGFYEIQVPLLGNVFHFSLWEQNHILSDISYVDAFGKQHNFPNITIPLDQKEEQLKELFGSSDDPALQYKYDFKNFFETTFLKGDSTMIASTEPESTSVPVGASSATPEIQLFIQKELLDKDFKNIETFLAIRFKNIDVSIGSGSYIIDLLGIEKTFAGNNSSYSTELSGKYIFNRHSFSRLTLKVKKEGDTGWYEWNGIPIEILPARISLLSLPESLKDLGYYIDTIRASYQNQKSIIIDLAGKRVLLDNIPFIPKVPTP